MKSSVSLPWRDHGSVRAAAAALLAVTLLALACSCDSSDSERHDPPPGAGALVIDNVTGEDLNVFLDGQSTNRVRSGSTRAYDLTPGVYRLVLDGRHSDRWFRDDIDILEGRLTILDVYIDNQDRSRFQVLVRIR